MNAQKPSRECTRCGACCVAPDIAALGKALNTRCPHLSADLLCTIYDQRPSVCRGYSSDELCDLIDGPTLDDRVKNYLQLFGLYT